MFPIEDLNESQQAAVLYTEGPNIVIAGAGSGKTRVLTYKIAYLLSKGIPAYSILAVTFTNKAAREMKSRIEKLVGGKDARYLWMGTFHALCARILRKEASALGYTNDYTIHDATDSKSMIKRIIKEMGLDDKTYKVNTVAARISMAKNKMQSPHDYASDPDSMEHDKSTRMPMIAEIYLRYNAQLRASNAMDFDDLLFNMNLLLLNNPEVKERYQKQFSYILVDEYQDTNYAQDMIIRTLAEPQENICVVGDDAQSIYSFRGADITHILSFQKLYPNAKLFKLEQNYRSTQNIVNAANSLIQKNRRQIPKNVFSEKEKGQPVQVNQYADDRGEAAAVAAAVASRHQKDGMSYQDFAILYRTNAQSRVIEDAFRVKGIPYKIYGGMSFYQRKEVKDALAYMQLAINPENTEALLRVINVPARGIGDTTVQRLTDYARQTNMGLSELLRVLPRTPINITSTAMHRLLHFIELIDSFAEKAKTATMYEFARDVLRRSGLLVEVTHEMKEEDRERMENLEELLTDISTREEDRRKEGEAPLSVAEFLSEISLLTDQDEKTDEDTPRTMMMTVHAAKGLEFPVVFIVGMENKLFPSGFVNDEKETEEERRLFYVAITRAEKECYISHVTMRFRNGQVEPSQPSLFLQDLDPSFVKTVGYTPNCPNISMSGFYAGPTKSASQPTPRRLTKIPNRGYSSTSGTSTSRSTGEWSAPKVSNLKWAPISRASTSRTSTLGDMEYPWTSAASKTSSSAKSPYNAGDRVNHTRFGKGTVLSVEDGRARIRFDEHGEKTILLQFATMVKIDN